MKLNQKQIEALVRKVFDLWKANNIVVFKEDEQKVFAQAVQHIVKDLQKEVELEKDVNKMLDQLERSNPGEFQRYKMYPILKQKMAKEKKVVL